MQFFMKSSFSLSKTPLLTLLFLAYSRVLVNAGDIPIESFDDPNFLWEAFADSEMMGGNSTGLIEVVDGIAIFVANVSTVANRNVPATVALAARDVFPDVSSCDGLKMTIMSSEEYKGYKIDFGYKKLPENVFAYGYRAVFDAPVGEFGEVFIPFNNFTLKWDDKTGDQLVACDKNENSQYCPDEATLQNWETITISAVGIEGNTQLHIKSIIATGCTDEYVVSEETDPTTEEEKVKQWTCSDQTKSAITTAVRSSSSSDISTVEMPPSDEITIESFANPSYNWMAMNDPVMGGASYSDVKMEDGVGILSGEVKNIPFLGLPGFITMEARGGKPYPDVSCCDSLKLNIMGMEEYAGYRVSFGTKRAGGGFGFAQGFKADFNAPMDTYGDIIIPFNMFSVKWDEATGDQLVTCAEDPAVCPDMETLQNMETIALWGEGVGGEINLRVKSISAVGCSSTKNAEEKDTNSATGKKTSTKNAEEKDTNSATGKKSMSSILIGTISLTLLFSLVNQV